MLKKMNLSGNPMMQKLPGCSRHLWEVWYGDRAGPMPRTRIECQTRPAQSSGTVKIRTTIVMKILRSALKDSCHPQGLTHPCTRCAPQQTDHTVSTKVLNLGGDTSGLLLERSSGPAACECGHVASTINPSYPPGDDIKEMEGAREKERAVHRGVKNGCIRQRGRGLLSKCLVVTTAVGAALVGIGSGVLWLRSHKLPFLWVPSFLLI
ncbi:hypothetical protein BSKO_06618 [Bryopsis sp. KO-2023]|nr:hypothetical protein BSKO_06618 [Bryopsis sp. KO-2023]